MTEPIIIDGVPEEFLDAAVNVGWGMGFSHLRRQIAAVMPLHRAQVRAEFAAEWAAILQEMREDGNVDLRTPIHMLRDIARGEA